MLDECREDFEHLYFDKCWPLRHVATHFKVSLWGLTRWMATRHIKGRGRVEAQQARRDHENHRKIKEDVIFMRLDKHMTLDQIARRTGFASRASVYNMLASLGLSGPLEGLPSYEEYLKGGKRREKA
jgi:hypothetical protein